MSLLPIRAIRDRLAAHLVLPGSGPRDAPARQRTLEGAIDWSHDLLSLDERRILHTLGVFEGGFDLEQAAMVASATDEPPGNDADALLIERLVALADQSLISRDASADRFDSLPSSTGIRFGLLKTVQAFALARLAGDGDEAATRRRHALAFTEVVEAAGRVLPGADNGIWIDRLSLDLANIRAALGWAIDVGESEIAMRLVGSSWRFWVLDGRITEGQRWTDAAFAMPGANEPTAGRLVAVTAAGGLAYWQGDQILAARWYEEQRSLAESLGDRPATADAYFNLASALFLVGDIDRASQCTDEARRRFVELGDVRGVARLDWSQANVTLAMQGPAAARTILEDALQTFEAQGDAQYVALAAGSLSWVSFASGDVRTAASWGVRAIAATFALRDVASTTISLQVGSMLATLAGRPDDGVAVWSAFTSLCDRYGVRPPVSFAMFVGDYDPLGRARAAVTPDAFDAAWARGTSMTLGEAVDLIVRIGDEQAADVSD